MLRRHRRRNSKHYLRKIREDFTEEVTFELCLKGWVYNPFAEISHRTLQAAFS